jgi:hypothetical protein
MLIEYSSIDDLDTTEKERLKQAAPVLLNAYEAIQGYIVFEKKCFSARAVSEFIASNPQILKG